MQHDDEDFRSEVENEERPPPPAIDAPPYLTNGHGSNGHRGRLAKATRPDGRYPPHNLEAETAVLASMLLRPAAVEDVLAEGLTEGDYYRPAHAAIHAAITRLRDDGVVVDAITVIAELQRVDLLDFAGGAAAIVTMRAEGSSSSAAGHYARIVVEHARMRRGIAAAGEIAELYYSLPENVDDADERAARLLTDARGGAPLTTQRAFPVHWVHETLEDPPPPAVDLVDGILARGEITGVGAPRNVGKSWFGMNLATLLSRGTGRFLGELDVRQRARTLICHGEMNRRGAAGRWQHLTGAYEPDDGIGETFQQWRLRVVERRTTTMRAGSSESDKWYDVHLDAGLEQTIAEHDIDVLIIDPWAVYYAGAENSNDEVEAALNRLREIAHDHDLAVLLFHHLRGGTDGDSPDPEDAWRGATRLPDAVDNRVTLLPHYTRKQAKDQGMTRKQARRFQDVYFLRRGAPAPDDIAIAWNPATGWWERWKTPQEVGAELGGRPPTVHYNPIDVVDVLAEAGGSWPSIRKAADDLGLSTAGATTLLERAVDAGHIEEYLGPKRARCFRLPGTAEPTLEDGRDALL